MRLPTLPDTSGLPRVKKLHSHPTMVRFVSRIPSTGENLGCSSCKKVVCTLNLVFEFLDLLSYSPRDLLFPCDVDGLSG